MTQHTKPKTLSATLGTSLLLAVALAACSKAEGPTNPLAPASGADSVEPTPSKGANGMLSVVPGTLGCTGTVADVAWNASSKPEVKLVQVFIGEGDQAKLFTTQMPVADAETGPWAVAGAVFTLRDAATGAELDRVVIGGNPCPTAAPAAAAQAPAATPAASPAH